MMDKLKVFISDDSATVREHLVTVVLDLPEIAVVGQAQFGSFVTLLAGLLGVSSVWVCLPSSKATCSVFGT